MRSLVEVSKTMLFHNNLVGGGENMLVVGGVPMKIRLVLSEDLTKREILAEFMEGVKARIEFNKGILNQYVDIGIDLDGEIIAQMVYDINTAKLTRRPL